MWRNARRWPIGEESLLIVLTLLCLLNQECDCRMDRVRRCRLLTPYQGGLPEIVLSSKKLNPSSKLTNWIKVDILSYFGTLIASHFY